MSKTVKELKIKYWTNVGVMREILPLATSFYDLHLYDDGIAGYIMWQRNNFRAPIISKFRDFRRRSKRDNKQRNDALKEDDRNFYFDFADIHGIVVDSNHKEIIILTSAERIDFHFRPIDDFEEILAEIKNKVDSKLFTRDDIKIKSSVYV